MKLNPATPTTIKQIFQEKYIIPEFQRPYSWDETTCDKLFVDISDAFEKDKSNQYYLGNIVAYKDGDDNYIIDGQQRLTTLMLFAKALLDCAGTFADLEKMLRVADPKTGGLSEELKITSKVLIEDFETLKSIVIGKADLESKHKSVKNYKYFTKLISDWRKEHNSSEQLDNFITYFLDKVLLLPIICDSMDDALIIFNTLNDRGLILTDADVFKGMIYSKIMNDDDKKIFIREWNELNKNERINNLFRDYMHLIRAQEGIVKKEIKLRDFFDKRLNDWKQIINDLKLLNVADAVYSDNIDTAQSSYVKNLWYALSCLPNDYCQYPIKIFWYQNAKLNSDDKSEFIGDIAELQKLLEQAIKYYYVFAVARPGVNYIKDKTFVVEAELYKPENNPISLLNYDEHKSQFKEMVKSNDYSNDKCKWGLVYLMSVLNPLQNQMDLSNISNPELEHILPQNGGYNDAAGWTQGQYDEYINGFGNLCICEKAVNIKASNNFFVRKQAEYRMSKIQDLLDLSEQDKTWTCDDYLARDKELKVALFKFFDIK